MRDLFGATDVDKVKNTARGKNTISEIWHARLMKLHLIAYSYVISKHDHTCLAAFSA
jgi:hypothetical protein